MMYAACGASALWAVVIAIRPTQLLVSGQCAEATVMDVYELDIGCPCGTVQFYDGEKIIDASRAGYFQRGQGVRVWYLPHAPRSVDDAGSLERMVGGACLSLGFAIVFGAIAYLLPTR